MSYKKMDNNFSFTDLSLALSMEHNPSIARMEKINDFESFSTYKRQLVRE